MYSRNRRERKHEETLNFRQVKNEELIDRVQSEIAQFAEDEQ